MHLQCAEAVCSVRQRYAAQAGLLHHAAKNLS